MSNRRSIIPAMLLGALMLAFSWCAHPMPWLLWNASASVPIGLYAVHPVGPLRVGQLLIVSPPAPLARFLAARRYLPMGVPLIKHVAALPGQTVCRLGTHDYRRWHGGRPRRWIVTRAADHYRSGKAARRSRRTKFFS